MASEIDLAIILWATASAAIGYSSRMVASTSWTLSARHSGNAINSPRSCSIRALSGLAHEESHDMPSSPQRCSEVRRYSMTWVSCSSEMIMSHLSDNTQIFLNEFVIASEAFFENPASQIGWQNGQEIGGAPRPAP